METTLSLLRTTRQRLLDETDDEDLYEYTGGNYDYLITVAVVVFFLLWCCGSFLNSLQAEAEAADSRGRRPPPVQVAPEASTERNTTATSNDNVGVSNGSNYEQNTQRRNRIDKMLIYKVRLDNVLPTKSRCNAFRVLTNILYSLPPFNI
jgi:hypothetical protein